MFLSLIFLRSFKKIICFFNYYSFVNKSSSSRIRTLRSFIRKISSLWSSLATITPIVQLWCKRQGIFLTLLSLNVVTPAKWYCRLSFLTLTHQQAVLDRYALSVNVFHLVPIHDCLSSYTKCLCSKCTIHIFFRRIKELLVNEANRKNVTNWLILRY